MQRIYLESNLTLLSIRGYADLFAEVFFLVLSPLIDNPFRLTTYDCVY
jgi:hypothetical protein